MMYTIGYSGFSFENFLHTIKANKISVIIDVRSSPHSSYFSDYNKEILENTLKANGIYYKNYTKEFGARQPERTFYSTAGYLDFEVFSKSEIFLSGLDKLKKGMQQDYKFALMCAEKAPIDCHRTILVARAFHDAQFKVTHLLPNDKTMTQEDIETRLLEMYFPNRSHLNLFEENLSEHEYILQAYKKRNAEIGYSLKEEYIK